jgi:hypothetical protein
MQQGTCDAVEHHNSKIVKKDRNYGGKTSFTILPAKSFWSITLEKQQAGNRSLVKGVAARPVEKVHFEIKTRTNLRRIILSGTIHASRYPLSINSGNRWFAS